MKHFADRLIEKIEKTGSFGCLGIDPRPDWNPPGWPTEPFSRELVSLAAENGLPAIKPQAAFLCDSRSKINMICDVARRDDADMLNVVDVKRGDIGTTAEAYAEEWLGRDNQSVDAITVNPYLGLDSLEPFARIAANNGRGIFVLVRTSNPGANDIQDLKIQPALDRPFGAQIETVCERVARLVNKLGESFVGEHGYSNVGAVVGATVDPGLVKRLRELMPQAIFLMPGLGAQGGGVSSVRAALDTNGLGVLAPSSRSLNYPWKSKDGKGDVPEGWRDAVRRSIEAFRAQLRAISGRP